MISDTLFHSLRDLGNEVSAEEGGFDGSSCPREWHEEAMFWQSPELYVSRDKLEALIETAFERGRDYDLDSFREAFRIVCAEEHSADWDREQERRLREADEREFARWQKCGEWRTKVCEAIERAVPHVRFRRTDKASAYATYDKPQVGFKIRVSDHRQVEGGGWIEDEFGGFRAGEAELCYTSETGDDPVPTRDQIRRDVLRLVMELRA